MKNSNHWLQKLAGADGGMSEENITLKEQASIDTTYKSIKAILEKARSTAYRAVNFAMVQAYWGIGRIIIEEVQKGAERAKYGKELIKEASRRLTRLWARVHREESLVHEGFLSDFSKSERTACRIDMESLPPSFESR